MSKDYLLVAAVKDGDRHKVREAIEQGASIDCRDYKARSILEVAEHYQQHHLLRFLVQAGANPNQIVGKQGNNLLLRSIMRHNSGFARALLECNADIHAKNLAGENALMLAVKTGDVYFADDLLQSGARINETSRSSDTALHLAARSGNTEMVSMLLKHCPDTAVKNKRHYTSLQEAVAHGHTDTSAFLLDRMILQTGNPDGQIIPARRTAEHHRQPKLLELLMASESAPGQSFTKRVRSNEQHLNEIWR
ncbi:MAG: ankyrin repeat domain-containing protein [Planctomycetaceae bacterium]|nr:ankyrin repeat domain-containing protein [Planctomycetaceae bacterium]